MAVLEDLYDWSVLFNDVFEMNSVMSDLEERFEDYRSESTVSFDGKTCPNCGATVTFDPGLGEMHCEYCGYHCKLPDPGTENEICEMDFESAASKESFEWGAEKKTVECKSCGAVTIYDVLETAAVCPFCGSTNVMPSATENSIAPGAVCPFSVTKSKAGECFTRWLKKKWFAPTKAKKNAQPDAFQGVYLPYWTYDAQTTSSFTVRVGYDRVVKKGDKKETVTDWRSVQGVYQEFFDDETVVASKRHENSGVKACEPFDFTKLVPYSPQVVAGFAAERYSIGLKEGWEKAQQSIQSKLRNDISQYAKSHWRADRVSSLKFSTLYNNITYKYLLVPVWMSSFKFKEKTYQFVVNGQTGKVGGKAPTSVWKVLLAVLIGAGIIAGLYFLLR
ncbi:MAG: TFIIB-type zinc ribbon-containing protein [Bacteroidales bacterium]|nr:TFIIB-type zinc ribbon-containing protein [Bacteroidales bacterium]